MGENKLTSNVNISDSSLQKIPLSISRYFSKNSDPFKFDMENKEIEWISEEVAFTDDKGKIIYKQPNVKKPKFWSSLALKVVASRYFWGNMDKNERESSVEQLISRVSAFYGRQAKLQGLFNEEQSKILEDEIAAICLNQLAVFNSPVWFNAGIQAYDKIAGGVAPYKWDPLNKNIRNTEKNEDSPQCSACFIQSAKDDME